MHGEGAHNEVNGASVAPPEPRPASSQALWSAANARQALPSSPAEEIEPAPDTADFSHDGLTVVGRVSPEVLAMARAAARRQQEAAQAEATSQGGQSQPSEAASSDESPAESRTGPVEVAAPQASASTDESTGSGSTLRPPTGLPGASAPPPQSLAESVQRSAGALAREMAGVSVLRKVLSSIPPLRRTPLLRDPRLWFCVAVLLLVGAVLSRL